MTPTAVGSNWAGNVAYRAGVLHHPRTIAEVQQLVGSRDRVRALGSRHSFTDIADSAELISLAALTGEIELDRSAGTVTVPGGIT